MTSVPMRLRGVGSAVGGLTTACSGDPVTVGRADGLELHVPLNEHSETRKLISAHHCIIEALEDRWELQDTSSNGLCVCRNGQTFQVPIGGTAELRNGDQIFLAHNRDLSFIFEQLGAKERPDRAIIERTGSDAIQFGIPDGAVIFVGDLAVLPPSMGSRAIRIPGLPYRGVVAVLHPHDAVSLLEPKVPWVRVDGSPLKAQSPCVVGLAISFDRLPDAHLVFGD